MQALSARAGRNRARPEELTLKLTEPRRARRARRGKVRRVQARGVDTKQTRKNISDVMFVFLFHQELVWDDVLDVYSQPSITEE
jgi:hypothetical protein